MDFMVRAYAIHDILLYGTYGFVCITSIIIFCTNEIILEIRIQPRRGKRNR